ncbi:hypothetical protein Tco_0703991 [Tanacetum coccineum]|uniref:Uncharacterized protein n=1 Tax=Tanacetum coccineum TaxID=301880 RepID=A0ABQ4Y1E3_9ASTR
MKTASSRSAGQSVHSVCNRSTITNADVRHIPKNDLLNANYVISTDNPFAQSRHADNLICLLAAVRIRRRTSSMSGQNNNPRRAFLIVALGEVTKKPTLERVLERTKRNPEDRVRHRRDLQDKS